MNSRKPMHPPGPEPFDVTLPEGFPVGERRSVLEEAGWEVESAGDVGRRPQRLDGE